jgi:hypothetical protein
MDSDRDMFVVDDTVYTGDTILDNKQQQSDLIQNWCVSTTRKKERKSYLFHPRKLDMEMSLSWGFMVYGEYPRDIPEV